MHDRLITVLRRPADVRHFTDADWEHLVRQGRAALLLGSVAAVIEEGGLMDCAPPAAARHLRSALAIAASQERAARWEAVCIEQALSRIDTPIVLLKGAAYAVAGLPPAAGRVMSDLDILVARDKLDEVEAALMQHGWAATESDPYNQHYYRTWMHELPPMRHRRRGTVIDVHHGLLPQTARSRPDPAKLLAAAQPLLNGSALHVLSPADMVLHCAAHLFHDGELEHGLRDLYDLDSLLRHFATGADFWSTLICRGRELGTESSLIYGLRYAHRLLGTSIPDAVFAELPIGRAATRDSLRARILDQMFCRALRPAHDGSGDRFTALARWLLYMRAHWLRMPPGLLAMHLMRKAVMRSQSEG
jgi:hypothetical protein